MRFTLLVLFLSSFCFAEYEKGKIDMHGGKEDYSYEKKGVENSKKSFMMQGMFLEQNSSKNKPAKK
ncbi:hypothetical protein [Sulfurimonas microaerophilic]|uniref:hypothetical protein n=1 Tax=Sulfurimonas microaerophilic TaxID=3058392 RepID=UPI002714866F|nr:hypothetical protein [Sulfurimonas sp. hsl 1-7]